MIVAIEGGDACGKATQAKILAERLGATLFSFPNYESVSGRQIRANLTGNWSAASSLGATILHTNAIVLQSLMLTNRMEQGTDLRKAAAKGHVVCDRYDASAMVYGTLDGLDPAWLASTNAQLPVRPDIYVLLDASVEESFKRRPERRDRYEKDREYLEKVRRAYQVLFAQEDAKRFLGGASMSLPKWRVVQAMGTVAEVAERVWKAVGL